MSALAAPGRERGAVRATPARLLFVTRRPPYPLDNGARIRAHRLLRGLAESFPTTLLTYDHDATSPDGAVSPAELAATLPDVDIVTVPGLGPGKRVAQAVSLCGPRSWEFGRYHRRAFGERLRHIVAERRPDIVHFDDIGVGSFAPAPSALTVFAPHNVEHRILAGNARAGSGLRRVFAELEWRKVSREERRLWRTADLVLAVSELDAETMRAGGARHVELCPNGTDRLAQLPVPRRAAGETLRLLFIGSGSYRPYEVGLSWFVREVYPRVAEALPTRFEVVGQPPRHPVEAAGVFYRGRVPSVLPYYERAHALVVPMFEGSGTRLKIVEAMAHGRPVVSTRLGAEGLPIAPSEHYIAAEDAQSFATALIELSRRLERPAGLDGMLERARSAAEPLFWDVIVRRLTSVYRSGLSARSLA
jgi:glycosyltransferase involved in cell wall biosynthesis